jgi:carboxylate-amine ligase
MASRVLTRSKSPSPLGASSCPDFKLGIEEEYFLADAESLEVAPQTPDALFDTCHGEQIDREFLQSQLEVSTRPHVSVADAHAELRELRESAALAARQHGLTIMASGTHPTARWVDSILTPKRRYRVVMESLQMIGRRNMLCGMHVHVEVPDPLRRVDIMTRMLPYLPLFLALSTSSPFWQSQYTGLRGYRLAAYDELPRTGMPELFQSEQEYESYIAALVRAGVIDDSSHIWWVIRPSAKYSTLELRAPDCCTRLRDGVAIAALYRALVRYLWRDREHNASLDSVSRAVAIENKWRAQRYGVSCAFVTKDGPVAVADVLDDLIALTARDADALGCACDIAHCRNIVKSGTSADMQVHEYRRSITDGQASALKAVSEWIRKTTQE